MTLFVRVTGLVDGKPGFLDPQGTKTPERIDMKLDMSDYVVTDITPHAKLGVPASWGMGQHPHPSICMHNFKSLASPVPEI